MIKVNAGLKTDGLTGLLQKFWTEWTQVALYLQKIINKEPYYTFFNCVK